MEKEIPIDWRMSEDKMMKNISCLTSLTSDQNLNCLGEKPLCCNYFLKGFLMIRMAQDLSLNDILRMKVITSEYKYLV